MIKLHRSQEAVQLYRVHPFIRAVEHRIYTLHRNTNIMLEGEGGIGKSTFATHVCNRFDLNRDFDQNHYSRTADELLASVRPNEWSRNIVKLLLRKDTEGLVRAIREERWEEGRLKPLCFGTPDEASLIRGLNTVEGRELNDVLRTWRLLRIGLVWSTQDVEELPPAIHSNAHFYCETLDSIYGPIVLAHIKRKKRVWQKGTERWKWWYLPPPLGWNPLTGRLWDIYEKDKMEGIIDVCGRALTRVQDKARALERQEEVSRRMLTA